MKHYDSSHFGSHDPDDMAYRSERWTVLSALIWIGIPVALVSYFMIWKAVMAILGLIFPL